MSRHAEERVRVVNPEMVTLARESRGWTQAQLAHELAVTQGAVSKIEAGSAYPSEKLLACLSKTLNYPEHLFSQDDPVYGPGLGGFFHRRRQSLPEMVLRMMHQHGALRNPAAAASSNTGPNMVTLGCGCVAILRASRTLPDGRVIRASEYGKRAFVIVAHRCAAHG